MRTSRAAAPSGWSGAAEIFLDACLLIRDIFTYALPGGLFFAVGLVSHRIKLAQVNDFLAPYHPPTWALALLLIAACTLAGHLLFAIVSLRVEFWKLVHWSDPDWLADYPTEVTARDLVLRHYFPDLFRAMDRRETRATFALASIAGLFLGWLVFFVLHPTFADIVIWTAGLVFLAMLTAMSSLGRVRKAIHAAGEEIQSIETQENAKRNGDVVIQPTGDELRYLIDAIFKAAELSSSKQTSLQFPEHPEHDSSATESREPQSETPAAAAAAASTFGTPRF